MVEEVYYILHNLPYLIPIFSDRDDHKCKAILMEFDNSSQPKNSNHNYLPSSQRSQIKQLVQDLTAKLVIPPPPTPQIIPGELM